MNPENNRISRAFAFLVVVVFMAIPARAAGPWYVSTSGNDANDCLTPGTACLTINAAIAKATAGDTINVAAGTYNEAVEITKTVTLLGAQANVDARTRAGAESIIENTCGAVRIRADNVVLNGFTVQGSTQSDPCTIAGIWMNPGGLGYEGGAQILNNIIQDNISGLELDNTCTYPALVQYNLFQNNNNTGPNGGAAIVVNFGLCNATIDSNRFAGHTNASLLFQAASSDVEITDNELVGGTLERFFLISLSDSLIDGNRIDGSTASSGAIRLAGGNQDVTISNNVIFNNVKGINVGDPYSVGVNSGIVVNQNCIAGNTTAGLEVTAGTHTGTLNAENNWWGATTGPTIASNPGGTGDAILDPGAVVDYDPFLTEPATACAVDYADLSVTKELETDPPYGPGDELTYTITVTNNGPGDATGVVVTDTLPPGTTFVSATPSQGSCSGTTTVTCNMGDLDNGASATITLVLRAPDEPGTVSNSASATSDQGDFDGANSTGTAAIVTSVPIPTASTWILMALAGMLAVLGAMKMRL